MFDSRMCAYSAAKRCIIDIVHLTDEGYRSHHFNESIETMRKRYPDAEITLVERAADRITEAFKEPVREITADEYDDMLCVLPPMDYKCGEGWTSFKMCERTSGIITGIYATNGDKYYTLQDSEFMPHSEIIKRCKNA